MFTEPDETVKKRALKDLETYTWVHLAGMSDVDDDESDSGWSIIAFSPEFVSQLEESAGIDVEELQGLISGSVYRFMLCLSRSIELAYRGQPLRPDSLRELFVGIDEILNFITHEEIGYRQSLIADRAEQPLPDFLYPASNRLQMLLEEYILSMVQDMKEPSAEVVAHLLAQCGSQEEENRLVELIEKVDHQARALLADKDISEEKLLDELIQLISSVNPEQ
jgi:hypothetical protein